MKIWCEGTGLVVNTVNVNPDQVNQPSVPPEDIDQLLQYSYFEEGDQALWEPDGDMIAVSSNAYNNIAVWGADTGEEIYAIPGDFEDKRGFLGSWYPSGDRFVTCGLGGIKVYDSLSGSLHLEVTVPEVFK